jgi:threonine dehydrogenase-like Zn-dependent dehydrogenase
MRGAVLYGPRDVRYEQRDEPKIIKPTDAIIRLAATCVCGSDLWPYRGVQPIPGPTPVRARVLRHRGGGRQRRHRDPGKVFDLTLPLEQVAEGYRAMDERRAIKTLLRPDERDVIPSAEPVRVHSELA